MKNLEELNISPAPWRYQTLAGANYVEDAERFCVSELFGERKGRVANNARMLAAAPELYEELFKNIDAMKNAIDQIHWTMAHIRSRELDDATGALYTAGHAEEYLIRAIETAHAALAKAGGAE